MSESIRIKGFAIRGLLKYVKESGHPGGIAGLLAGIPAAQRPFFDQRILSSAWYPYEGFTCLLEAIDRAMGNGDAAFLEQVGAFSGSQDAGTIFKVVLTLTSIERIVAVGPPFWKRYCDHGYFEKPEVSAGRFTIRLLEFPDIHPGHCRLITGWIKGVGLRAGAQQPQAEESACVHRGDPYCEFGATWA